MTDIIQGYSHEFRVERKTKKFIVGYKEFITLLMAF